MTDRPRVPTHVLVMLSACTAGYGLSLAAVAASQSSAELDLAAQRAPAVDGVSNLGAGHDALHDRLDAARRTLDDAVATYQGVAGRLDRLEASLADLGSTVAGIDGVTSGLPTSIRMPTIKRVAAVSGTTRHVTTGASGG